MKCIMDGLGLVYIAGLNWLLLEAGGRDRYSMLEELDVGSST